MTRWHLTGLDEQPAGVGGQGALELPLLHPAPPLPLLHGVGTPLLEIEQVTSLFLLGTDIRGATESLFPYFPGQDNFCP